MAKTIRKRFNFQNFEKQLSSSVPCVRVNEQLITAQEVLAKNPDFTLSPVENILIYQGRGKPKYLEEFKENKIFFMKMATKYVIDRLDIEPLKGIAIYSDVPNNIYLDLLVRFSKTTKVDYIVNHLQTYLETRKAIEENGFTGISIYNASFASIITCVSRPVNTFICLPKSTTFDLLRSTPDYFLRIKQEKLDEIIKEEMESLEASAKVVEIGGRLVYMIPTICKKESSNLIGNFLTNHPNFELVEEKQFFPFESFDSCLYYAILKRRGE